jgi:hypothetical protein
MPPSLPTRYLRALPLALAGSLLACGSDPAAPAAEPAIGPSLASGATATSAVMGTALGGFGTLHSEALALSRSGLIGGLAHSTSMIRHPVLFEAGQQLALLPDAPGQLTGIGGLSDLASGGTAAVGERYAWTRAPGGAWSAAVTLPDLGGGAAAHAVNASGIIAGYLRAPGGGASAANAGKFVTPTGATAALWTPDGAGGYTFAQIAGLPGCIAHSVRAINDEGVAAGWSVCASGKSYVSRPFVTGPGLTAQALPLGGFTSVQAVDISEAGHVVGQGAVGNRTDAVLLWTRAGDGSYGAPVRVLDIDSNNGLVTGVNGCGAVIGRRTANNDIQGFVVASGQVTDLYPFPGSEQAWADEINDAGLVVGYGWVVSGKGRTETATKRATAWQAAGC